jgi:hypothetical protein
MRITGAQGIMSAEVRAHRTTICLCICACVCVHVCVCVSMCASGRVLLCMQPFTSAIAVSVHLPRRGFYRTLPSSMDLRAPRDSRSSMNTWGLLNNIILPFLGYTSTKTHAHTIPTPTGTHRHKKQYRLTDTWRYTRMKIHAHT